MAAFTDVQSNPANAAKYESNPKVKKVMEKLSATLGGAAMGGRGAAGGMGGRGPPPTAAGFTAPPNPNSKPPEDPVGSGMDLD